MASIDTAPGMLAIVSEVVSPLASELFMFGLAAVVYLLFTRSFTLPAPARKGGIDKAGKQLGPKAAPSKLPQREPREQQKSWRKEMEELPAEYHPAMHAAKAGDATAALAALAALDASSELPQLVAGKVLLTLARTPTLSEELMHQFMDLSSLFDVKVFENAASEASRWRNVAACRQLFNLAGLAGVQKSDRLLVALARGHSNDHAALRGMVEDILAEGSGINLTRSLAEALLAQCSSAGDAESTQLLGERCEALRGAYDATRQAKQISNFGKEGNLQAALALFHKLQDSGSTLTSMTYNCLLDACVECKDLPSALRFFKEMKEKSLADVVSYNTVMKGHMANGDTVAARQLFAEMGQQGFTANRVTYHGLLNTLVSKGDRQGAWKLVDEMTKQHGLSVNTITCTILLKSITNRSHAADLQKVITLSDESEAPMDEVLFGAMADVCIRIGNLKILWERLRLHTQGEKAIQVSGATYGNMVKAAGQARDIQRVRSLWAEMCAKKVKVSAVTLGCVVEALVMNHHTDDAWELVHKIWEDADQRSLINTVVYSTIVKGFTMSRQHDKVVAIYKEMKARSIGCNTITYNTMLNALARCGMMHEVPQLLEDMRSSVPPIEPDIVTYSTLVKGYCLSGDLDKGLELLEEMKRSGHVKPDEVLYNSLLDGCSKQSRLDQALALLDEMRDAGVAPSNYTLSIICKLLSRARRLDQAFATVESMSREYGFTANIQVYTCLMQACFHNRQCQRALSLHDEVVSKGLCTPDEKTYTVMARGCLLSGFVEKAAEVVRCSYHLPGTRMQLTSGTPRGVELACLEEVVRELGFHSVHGKQLLKDLYDHCGITVNEPAAASHTARRPRGYGRSGR
eukprot:gb/GFBE01016110.1/.p1 GENE.gb/GFBE01016110.1/~~gb/GFBE01016110.1/.p1  ORF type:complete len:860 (+),score=257.03 gb/GFBE01016110.1/:1-2580(+)